MKYVVFLLSGLNAAWLVYLCVRSFTLRMPGQQRMYRAIGPASVMGFALMFGGLLGLACAAANAGGEGAWCIAVIILALVMLFTPLISKAVAGAIAFSGDGLAVRDLFGPMRTYCWADVQACTVRAESARGGPRMSVTYNYDMYMLTLPDRVLCVNSGEDAGRELLQVLERRRPELKAVRTKIK